MKTVSEVARLSGISVRTLHHYDRIGLLKPTHVAGNGYRYYDDKALSTLQEILLFKELDFSLKAIKKIMVSADYDRQIALSEQITLLELKRERLDRVIAHAKCLQEEVMTMTFAAYNNTRFQDYRREVQERWGNTEAYGSFNRRNVHEDSEYLAGLEVLFRHFGALQNTSPEQEIVQDRVKELKAYITDNFYPCTDDILRYLGQLYISDKRFTVTIDKMGGTGTALFVNKAIMIFTER